MSGHRTVIGRQNAQYCRQSFRFFKFCLIYQIYYLISDAIIQNGRRDSARYFGNLVLDLTTEWAELLQKQLQESHTVFLYMCIHMHIDILTNLLTWLRIEMSIDYLHFSLTACTYANRFRLFIYINIYIYMIHLFFLYLGCCLLCFVVVIP